jgi:hypothetical protein
VTQQSRHAVSLSGNVSSEYSDQSGLETERSPRRGTTRRGLHSGPFYRVPTVLSRNSRLADPDEVRSPGDAEEGRHLFGPDRRQTLAAISETLGAINTVGRYLVNFTRGGQTQGQEPEAGDLPGALYTISKNVLGPNVTDTIAPIVRDALPPLVTLHPSKVTLSDDAAAGRPCTTPNGHAGTCDDLSSCPQLLLDLGNLRQSICFKSLFVPGVCCPRRGASPT